MPPGEDGARLLMVTGETSGDRYGGLLAGAIRERLPRVGIRGIGGPRMASAGVDILYDADAIAVTGLLEVVGSLGPIRAAWRVARAALQRERPDAVILVDYPDFNLAFARVARRAGIPVIYFVGPQVWAWRRYRVRRIARDVTRMLVILPFEESFYRENGVSARFVGHPLVDLVRPVASRERAAAALGIPEDVPVLGLLPGSRRNEIRAVLPAMLAAAGIVERGLPGLRTVLPVASPRHLPVLEEMIRDAGMPVLCREGDFPGTVGACDAILAASGTATLEVSLMGVPLVITYRVSRWTYGLVSRLSSVTRAGLPNLILGRDAVPERLQEECRGDALASAVLPLMRPGEPRSAMLRDFDELRRRLGGGGAIERAADAVVELLGECPAPATRA
ncbi:MAG: lipid-A-disaccharide synthase [Acidobacteriota bacterium]|jgi:lipid-A-disaccharide synthase